MREQPDKYPELLSVVVITKNEEKRIRTCLKSIFTACDGTIPFEIILVDSNSTDRTIDIAADYPIDIYTIRHDEIASPAAGRYVGAHFSRGNYLLFIDGDMEIREDWVDTGIDILRDCPAIGGVSGFIDDHDQHSIGERIRAVKVFNGHGLFTATAYQEADGFDPSILGSEDYELCYRITESGYSLIKLPKVTVQHPPYRGGGIVGAISDVIRRVKAGYTVGIGQVFRKHVTNPVVVAIHASLHWRHVAQLLWLLCSIFVLALSISLFGIWLFVTAISITIISIHSDEYWLISLWRFVRAAPETLGILIGFLGLSTSNDFTMQSVSQIQSSSTQPHNTK